MNVEDIANCVASKTEALLKKIVLENTSQRIQDFPKEEVTKNDSKHVVVVESKEDGENKHFNNQTWADVLKTNISKKLEDVPVTKTYLNREGKGHIVFPDEKSCNAAKNKLAVDFQVSQSVSKPKVVLPKLKIHNLKMDQFDNNEQLQEHIIKKNEGINALLSGNSKSKLSVLFTDKKYNFAVVKVTPDVREIIMQRSRIYINLESYYVSDHYHVQQCYACQGFGHRQDSSFCPKKDTEPTCMFCAGAHRSRLCTFKNNAENHKCVNCANSPVPGIRAHANDHKAGSRKCPVYEREIEYAKKRTCFGAKNFADM